MLLRLQSSAGLNHVSSATESVRSSHFHCDYVRQTRRQLVNAFARICLSTRLGRLLKNTCMDLDEMLRVDRYRDMDELINF